MGLRAIVRTGDYPEDDPDLDPDFDGDAVVEVEFEAAEIVAVVNRLLGKLAGQGVGTDFQVLSPDHLLELFENGGEVEVADVADLAEELTEVEEALDDVTFDQAGDVHHCEHFLDGMQRLVEASLEHEVNIEIENDEGGIILDDDEEETPETLDTPEDESPVAEDGEDDLGFDDDMDPDLEAELEAEFAGEFPEEEGAAPVSEEPVDDPLLGGLARLLRDVKDAPEDS